jgi:hypothetical protein
VHTGFLTGRVLLVTLCVWVFVNSVVVAQEAPEVKVVPRLQVIPQAYDQASFQRDGVEITRYHFGEGLERPFLFPVVGP